ncbi:MAG TPA: class I SAM-dependent methyltransferase [Fimbriimonadaceae bacterium]|nr:class I SAM-dependent methyltransferase [Fimbriimonadaceae bacterium]
MNLELDVDPQALWDSSAPAWIALIEGGHLNRDLLLDPVMLRLAGDVRGQKACDIGCGEGRFCRILSHRGASVVGLDPTIPLLGEARRKDPSGHYIEGVAEALPFADETFDLTVSYLVLIDVLDYRTAIAEMARVTRPGGKVLVANMSSFCTTLADPWIRDDDEGRGIRVVVEDYLHDRADIVEWAGIRIVNYHRPLSGYMRAFLDAGLSLAAFEEPTLTPGQIEAHPKMANAARIPMFNVSLWRKA